MNTKQLDSNKIFEELTFPEEDNMAFHSLLHKGNDRDILGLEQIPHLIDAVGLSICIEGEASVLINSQNYHLSKGSTCIVLPNTLVHVLSKSEDYRGFTFGFASKLLYKMNIPSATPLFLYVKENPCLLLDEKEQTELIKICSLIEDHDLRKDHPFRKEVSHYMVGIIIYEVLRFYQNGKVVPQQVHSQKNVYYFRFLDLLSQYSGKHMSADFYADKLCITSRYLSMICKEIAGFTATECINKHILMNARLLLLTSGKTISQISEELSFANTSFFSQFFKKHEGCSPRVFRNANAKDR